MDLKPKYIDTILAATPKTNRPKRPHSERKSQTVALIAESLFDPENELDKQTKENCEETTYVCLIIMSNPHQLQAQKEG